MEIIKIEECSFRYEGDKRYALRNVSCDINKGEWVALVGSNGSGKSTLTKLIVGLLMPTLGTIKVNNVIVSLENVWEVRKQVGIVFQNPDQQFVGTTVADDVAFGLENSCVEHEEMVDRVATVLELVGMSDFVECAPHALSGGQKQRVAIAGILALEPTVMILDEATSMLDPVGKSEVLNVLQSIKEKSNLTIVMVTHDMEEALRADKIVVMNEGKITCCGTPKEVFSNGDLLKAAGLELPFCLQISELLKEAGVPLSGLHVSMKSLVDEICK